MKIQPQVRADLQATRPRCCGRRPASRTWSSRSTRARKARARRPSGCTIPVARPRPTSTSTRSSPSLDADTRDYLRLLLGGRRQGLDGQRPRPLGTLPALRADRAATSRRLNGALADAPREHRAARSTTSALLAEALGGKDNELAELVDSSNAVFQAFANQDANLRDDAQLLPGALRTTNTALAKADHARPRARPDARRAAARRARARPALQPDAAVPTQTTPIIQNQLGPFARDALPTVKALRPAARDLAALTPELTTRFEVVNTLLNELAYNPPGTEEGYLFWARG